MPWSIGQSILCQQCQNDWLRCQPRPIDIIASEDSLKHFILQECLETMRRPEIQALIAESGYDLEVIGTLFQRGSNAVCKFFNVPAVQFDITSVSQQILEQLKK